MMRLLKKERISTKQLAELRRALEAVPGRMDSGEVIHVAIALPEPCSAVTREYAEYLIDRLKTVKCEASVCFVLSFPASVRSEKRYEVMPVVPLGRAVIRVYES